MYKLSRDIIEEIQALTPRFGFNGLGELVYYRTYSRLKEDGTQETWNDTVLRVIAGVMDIRYEHYKHNKLIWKEAEMQEMAKDMAISLFKMEWMPPGRGLWAMGTQFVKERGAAALNNCGAVDTQDLIKAATWAMDMLMCGVGIGYNLNWSGQKTSISSGVRPYKIPDSREGWVESVKRLLEHHIEGAMRPEFDYSEIRKEGEPIRGFGGTASGAGPLIELHNRIDQYMMSANSPTRVVSDLFNAIGACVVAGNVRRSALINLGSPEDEEFLDLKDYEKNPERADIGWMSNNTAVFKSAHDFNRLPGIAKRIQNNGEPGICNLLNVQKYGRFGEKSWDDAWLANPCQSYDSLVLSPEGLVKFGSLNIGDAIWSSEGWTTVVDKKMTGHKPVYRYHTTAGYFEGTQQHRILQGGVKVEVEKASHIDLLPGYIDSVIEHNMDCILDGLVLGDGTMHKASNNLIVLCKSKRDEEAGLYNVISDYIKCERTSLKGFEVITSIKHLDNLRERTIPEELMTLNRTDTCSLLRGLYTANGSVISGRVVYGCASKALMLQIQILLSSVGIRSYYTTTKGKNTTFTDGRTYYVGDTYRLNISTDRDIFATDIGFMQEYKQDKLWAYIANMKRPSRSKNTYPITEIEYMGVRPVYDITVNNKTHTYWTQGLDVSNCSEIPLESYELCNLVEVFPTRCGSTEIFGEALRYATFYASTVSLLPTHREESNQVIARNRRIGVSLSGLADLLDEIGATRLTQVLREGYKRVKGLNEWFNKDAGVPPAIRCTTVKPSGTISQLAGVSSGMHFPTFKYAIRRVRVGNQAPICKVLTESGVPHEPEAVSAGTTVFEFPIDQGATREASQVSAWEQFAFLAMLQREWSDNMVSCTIYFDKEREGPQVESMLAQFAPVIKSVSMLPHSDAGAYKQMPYEGIAEEEYQERLEAIPDIDWSKFIGDGSGEKYCNNDSCEI